MAVYDRWHKSRPKPGEPVCREHKAVPTGDHGKGDRWQVRWRDEQGEQRARNFGRKTGKDPEACAETFDAKVKTQLDDGSYVAPKDANTTFRAFAEDWRKTRTHDVGTAARIERELRLHVYPAIGHRTLRELAKRPSLIQSWIADRSRPAAGSPWFVVAVATSTKAWAGWRGQGRAVVVVTASTYGPGAGAALSWPACHGPRLTSLPGRRGWGGGR
jgi:hypothetical protein